MSFVWQILNVFKQGDNIAQVQFLLKATDGKNAVETEGYHQFLEGTVVKPYSEIKEEDLIRWLDQDTTQDEVNLIKLNLEKQLKELENSVKADFPWEVDTFTIG